ncbi:MAG: beta-N-acetylhexosaminidase [Acidobacteria bacterium 13_1_40CM_4_57_6]|nr:MAG: beta-N-acetylhexosaminidase [Acidobacteria bacterium 13_1_40CM_4_57_6]
MRIRLIASAALLLASHAMAQPQHELNLMPMPTSVQPGFGRLAVDQSFSVATTGYKDAMLERGIHRFVAELSRQTGMSLKRKLADSPSPTLLIHAVHGSERVQRLSEDESYELVISESGAKLTAPSPLGILHGLQTFLQLVETTANGFSVPVVTIEDRPRFAWRGLLVDVGRHFIPLDVLKRNLDGMAAVKMNVLHWHLYDNEGFRVESKRFPRLQEAGSDGLYYTQDEIREFVAYAHDRGIRIVPEFEMPGHSRSLFAGYPELASGPGPYKIEPGGADAVMDPTQEKAYKFIDKLFEEMAKLFPDDYFHIGGDEVNGSQWAANPKIQTFIHSHGMKTNQDLQAYFNQRLQKILSKHHKIMMGWDEVLHPDLPRTVVVQSWRGQESLATAARQGYSSLLSFGYYLDLMWPASRHYTVDPMSGAAASLNPQEKSHVIGGEACMWAEWVTPENIDSRIWPRSAAIAERLWSSPEVQDLGSMYTRLDKLSRRLEWLGLTHRSSMVPAFYRMAGTNDIAALRTLAEVVEPVKDYTRMNSLKTVWDFRGPLNRLVDIVRPESDQARRLRDVVQTYIASGYKDKVAEGEIRTRLAAWRDNDARLHPLLEQSFLLSELAPLSEDLSTLGAAGLLALDYLDKSTPSPRSWRVQQRALVERAKTPKADLLLMVVEPVQQLIEGSGGQTQEP